MKKLTLIRHGKSDHSAHLADRDRPLNPRGEADAAAMAEWLKTHYAGCAPQQIFSSPARRALTTAKIIAPKLDSEAATVVTDARLYTFEPEPLYRFLETLDDQLDFIALVGHNPAMTLLINELCSNTSIDNLPTCGVAELALAITEWVEIAPHSGKLLRLQRPSQLC